MPVASLNKYDDPLPSTEPGVSGNDGWYGMLPTATAPPVESTAIWLRLASCDFVPNTVANITRSPPGAIFAIIGTCQSSPIGSTLSKESTSGNCVEVA